VRQAISATVTGGLVELNAPPGTRITLDGNEISITNTRLSITSSGEGAVIDGAGRSRLFTLLAGASLELIGVNCKNGWAAVRA
jgi:hypothetical protein